MAAEKMRFSFQRRKSGRWPLPAHLLRRHIVYPC